MEFPGKYLKAERESRNLSLKEVSESTKIKERFLKDIEDDQYEHLPHPVYVKGFLNIYAKYLGLDPNDIILRHQKYQESKDLLKGPELKQRITFPKKRASLWLFFIFVMILFIGGLIYLLLI
ncbi:MAG: helix-turn-helix domain-containing protein [Pseudomonadota bacterium]